ncbi:MAG: hypothetical protein WC775_00070 [Patescibacteria group bacterium]|jgi:hypothetical protein
MQHKIFITGLVRVAAGLMIVVVSGISALAYFLNSDFSPTVLSANQHVDIVTKPQRIVGTFTASEMNLGIVSLKFDQKIPLEGSIHFSLRRFGSNTRYAVSTITAPQLMPETFIDFGLPIIKDSKNVKYVFEISLKSKKNPNQRMVLSSNSPVFITRYSFSKKELLTDREVLRNFIYKKLSYYASTEHSWKIFFIYSIPILLYILYLAAGRHATSTEDRNTLTETLRVLSRPSVLPIIAWIWIETFLIRTSSDMSIALPMLWWFVCAAAYRLSGSYSFRIALFFFAATPLLVFAHMSWVAEKSAVWAFAFLTAGVTIRTFTSLFGAFSPIVTISDKVYALSGGLRSIDSLVTHGMSRVIDYTFKTVGNFLRVLTALTLTITLFFAGIYLYIQVLHYMAWLREDPTDPIIEPTLVYQGVKVVLYGDHFGDNTYNRSRLMRGEGEIKTDHWSDNMIVFTVPLNWNLER